MILNILTIVFFKEIKWAKNGNINSFQATAPLTGQEKGYFFKGAYLPQKLTQKSSIETHTVSVQGYVLSYILKTCPEWFVWAIPPLLI
jgi:hypothetical protein